MSSHHTSSSSSSTSSGYKINTETRSSTARASFSHAEHMPDQETRRKMFDRHFSSAGLGGAAEDEFLASVRSPLFRERPFFSSSPLWPRRRLGHNSGEELRVTPDRFRVLLDVALYEPDDLSVVTSGRHVVVSGKHQERACSEPAASLAGMAASREFRHSYLLPDDASSDLITSSISRDGVLIVEGPRRPTPGPSRADERVVSISTSEADALSPEGATGDTKS